MISRRDSITGAALLAVGKLSPMAYAASFVDHNSADLMSNFRKSVVELSLTEQPLEAEATLSKLLEIGSALVRKDVMKMDAISRLDGVCNHWLGAIASELKTEALFA